MRISDWSSDVCSSDLLRINDEAVERATELVGFDARILLEQRSDLRLRVQRIAVLVDRIEQCHVHGVEHAERHRGIERARMPQTLRMAERVRIAHAIDVRRLALHPGATVWIEGVAVRAANRKSRRLNC